MACDLGRHNIRRQPLDRAAHSKQQPVIMRQRRSWLADCRSKRIVRHYRTRMLIVRAMEAATVPRGQPYKGPTCTACLPASLSSSPSSLFLSLLLLPHLHLHWHRKRPTATVEDLIALSLLRAVLYTVSVCIHSVRRHTSSVFKCFTVFTFTAQTKQSCAGFWFFIHSFTDAILF